MNHWTIINRTSGAYLGTYESDSEQGAIRALNADAGEADLDRDDGDLRVTAADGHCAICLRAGVVVPSPGDYQGEGLELVADPERAAGRPTCEECHDADGIVSYI